MPSIEPDHITRQESAHHRRNPYPPRAKQEMPVVRHQCPGRTDRRRFRHYNPKTTNKVRPVFFVLEDVLPVHPADDDVMQSPCTIYSALSRHAVRYPADDRLSTYNSMDVPL